MIGKRLEKLRNEKGLTKKEVASIINVDQSTYGKYELDQREPNHETTNKLASFFNVSTDYLLGNDYPQSSNILYIPVQGARLNADYSDDDMVQFPVIGEIAAGFDSSIFEEDTGDYVSIPRSTLSGRPASDYFVLRIKGNSMYPMYLEGDKVLILKTPSVDSGSVAVVQYNGDEASLKKVEYVQGEDWFDMIPINPEYRPKRISGPSLLECNILGLAKMLIRDINQGTSEVRRNDSGTINKILKMAYKMPDKYLKIARGEGGVVEEITDPEQQKAIDRMLNEPWEDADF